MLVEGFGCWVFGEDGEFGGVCLCCVLQVRDVVEAC